MYQLLITVVTVKETNQTHLWCAQERQVLYSAGKRAPLNAVLAKWI